MSSIKDIDTVSEHCRSVPLSWFFFWNGCKTNCSEKQALQEKHTRLFSVYTMNNKRHHDTRKPKLRLTSCLMSNRKENVQKKSICRRQKSKPSTRSEYVASLMRVHDTTCSPSSAAIEKIIITNCTKTSMHTVSCYLIYF